MARPEARPERRHQLEAAITQAYHEVVRARVQLASQAALVVARLERLEQFLFQESWRNDPGHTAEKLTPET